MLQSMKSQTAGHDWVTEQQIDPYSAFFMVQLSLPYMTAGKNTALTIWTFVVKVMSLLFNMLSRFIIAFLSRSKCLLISWLQSPSTVILEPKKIKSVIFPLFPHLLAMKSWTGWHDLSFLVVSFYEHTWSLNLVFPKKHRIHCCYYFNPSNTNSFAINILRNFSASGEIKYQLRPTEAIPSDCLPWELSWGTHRTLEHHALNSCVFNHCDCRSTKAELSVIFNSDHPALTLLLHNNLCC